jgi:hypothetical protein
MSLASPNAPEPGKLPVNGAIMPHGSDNNLIVEFYKRAVQNRTKTMAEGRPIFDEVDYVKILVPGDRNMSIDKKVTDADKERFAARWERYQAGQEQTEPGTPIAQWPILTVREVAELHAINVQTIEQLSMLSDGACSKFTGLMLYRDKARLFIASAKDQAAAFAQDQTIRDQNEKIALQGQQIADMQRTLEALVAQGVKLPAGTAGPTTA